MFWSQWGVLRRYYITLVNLTNDPLHCHIFRTETTRNHRNIEKKLPKNVDIEVVKSLLLTWSHWAATIKVTAANKYGRNKCRYALGLQEVYTSIVLIRIIQN